VKADSLHDNPPEKDFSLARKPHRLQDWIQPLLSKRIWICGSARHAPVHLRQLQQPYDSEQSARTTEKSQLSSAGERAHRVHDSDL
jgi:hypothetical protein